MELKIIPSALFDSYLLEIPQGLKEAFDALEDAELSTPNFSFYTSVASVYSSKIEGEEIDLDSYIRHKRDGISFQPDYTRKIDDLYDAYFFARHFRLCRSSVFEAHQMLSKHLLDPKWQGKFRVQNMYVATPDGKIEYVAANPHLVESEMDKLFGDIENLLNASLSIEQVFFFASLIHLVFVKIHPWNDGNGRSARLIEKWFLAEKLGQQAWFIQSEKMYYQHHQTYYQNIRVLGLEYESINFDRALPFLLLLPGCLIR